VYFCLSNTLQQKRYKKIKSIQENQMPQNQTHKFTLPETKTVVIVGGYGRSGKTSLLREIAKDYPVFSTSQYLDAVCSALLESGKPLSADTFMQYHYGLMDESGKYISMLQNKNDELCLSLCGQTCRQLKIYVAEQIIVPYVGRDVGIVQPTIRKLLESQGRIRFLESIGGDEYVLAKQALIAEGFETLAVNIRSATEEACIDIRQLLPSDARIGFDADEWYNPLENSMIAYRKQVVSLFLMWVKSSMFPQRTRC
jgi:hypothetical protein